MPFFKKRPVRIEARRFDGTESGGLDLIAWMESYDANCWLSRTWDDRLGIQIETLEGVIMATRGDMIIKGVEDEFYPCKPDIFTATYDDAA